MWLPVILVAVFGYPRLSWNDDLSALNHSDPALLQEDERVRARVSRMEGGQIVAVIGSDEQDALQKNDAVYRLLKDGDLVESFRSIHTFLWSKSLQEQSRAAIEAARLPERIGPLFQAEGFQPEAFSRFRAGLGEKVQPLVFQDLAASPLGSLITPFRARAGDRWIFFTFLRGVKDRGRLQSALDSVEGAVFFDQVGFLAEAYRGYRERSLELVAVGLIGVFLLVLLRYRNLRLALAAFVPALAASAGTLGFLGLLGLEANLMHLVALLLVLSIGVDYGVFMVEHRNSQARSATLLSIVVACFTTVLSFGVLAMSMNPALRSLGVAVGVGVFLALILAPTALVFFSEGVKDT